MMSKVNGNSGLRVRLVVEIQEWAFHKIVESQELTSDEGIFQLGCLSLIQIRLVMPCSRSERQIRRFVDG